MKTGDKGKDQILADRIQSGDYGAFRELFDLYYPQLLKTAWHFVPDQNACKDIVQDVFFEFWKKRDQIGIHTSLKAYLRQSTVNKSLNYIKSRKRLQWEETSESVHIPGKEISAQQSLEAGDLQTGIQRAIDALPEKCRLVFVMSRLEDMSHKEIAEQLDISVKTIENHMTKALKLLKAALEENGYLLSLAVLLCIFISKQILLFNSIGESGYGIVLNIMLHKEYILLF